MIENIQEQPARKYRGKGINNRPPAEQAELLFSEVFKTLKDDLTKATPAERINAAIQLAGYFLTPKPKLEN